jgi:hypothetical protein
MCGTVKESTMAKLLSQLFRLPSQVFLFKKIPSSSSPVQNNTLFGRWALDYDGVIQGTKVYWANMDNCGCCHGGGGESENNKKKDDAESDEHILPYIM